MKEKEKIDVSSDIIASVTPRRLMPDFEAEACDTPALPLSCSVLNVRKNKIDSKDKHDGCRDPKVCRRVKEKKKCEESPEEVEKATEKAREEMLQVEYYVGDMTQTIALTVPMQGTGWQSRLSLLFKACLVLNLHLFQLLVLITYFSEAQEMSTRNGTMAPAPLAI